MSREQLLHVVTSQHIIINDMASKLLIETADGRETAGLNPSDSVMQEVNKHERHVHLLTLSDGRGIILR